MYAEFCWAQAGDGGRLHPATKAALQRQQTSSGLSDLSSKDSMGSEGCSADPLVPDVTCHLKGPEERSANLNYSEVLARDLILSFPVEEVYHQSNTRFQKLQFIKTRHFGRCLMIDNHVQSTESDELVYHESLVHPALLSHPNPKSVFIGGGAEGATLREVLRHQTVDEVVMVDIDQTATELCRKYLPEWSRGAFDDPRVTVIYDDAAAYLQRCNRRFDVILMDICDPIREGPGWKLYTKEFYEDARNKYLASPHGVFATQSTSVSVNSVTECFSVINRTLREVFDNVTPLRVHIPSFGSPWGFHVCTSTPKMVKGSADEQQSIKKKPLVSVHSDPKEIDADLEERIGKAAQQKLGHFDGETALHMLRLCRFERKALQEEDRILSLENPVFML